MRKSLRSFVVTSIPGMTGIPSAFAARFPPILLWSVIPTIIPYFLTTSFIVWMLVLVDLKGFQSIHGFCCIPIFILC